MDGLYIANETNSENTDGICTVIYSSKSLSCAEIKEVLAYAASNRSKFRDAPLLVNGADEFFSFKERETPVSKAAAYHRYECYGSC